MRGTCANAQAAWVRAGLAVGALGCALGCAVGPNYVERAPPAPAAWSRVDGAARPAVHAGARGDLSRWWRRLDDPVLTELVERALRANPDVRSARARVREARARLGVAAADLFPRVDGSAAARHGQVSAAREGAATSELARATADRFSADFDASWELDVFGGIRRGVEAADADLASATADLLDTRVSLLAEVALNYVQVRALQARIDIARANLASQAETLQLTEWRAQAGLVSSLDVEQARTNVEQTRAQLPALEVLGAEAEHRLDVLVGEAPGTVHARLAARGDLPTAPASIAVGIPADTLRQRPDVRAAERRLAAATARVGVAEAARYPRFTLTGSIGLEALSLVALGDGGAAAYALLGGVTAPLFDAGRLANEAEAQDAVREQAQRAWEGAVLTALQDVEDALVALASNRERADTLARAVGAARSAAELARQQYGTGLIDFQAVLDTERTVLTLEDSLASTRADAVLALVRLYKALGGGWSPADAP